MTCSSARPIDFANITGVSPALRCAQQREGRADLVAPRLRGGIVERDDEIRLRRRDEPLLDQRPGLQIVGQRDGAEIMAQRRAEPRRRRLHRRYAGRNAHVDRAPGRLARSIASKTAAAMAKTPGSPPDTTATCAPATASAQRGAGAVQLFAIVARVPRLAGALRAAREIGRIADEVGGLGEHHRGFRRDPVGQARADADDRSEPACARSWPPALAGNEDHREIGRMIVGLFAELQDFLRRLRAMFDIDRLALAPGLLDRAANLGEIGAELDDDRPRRRLRRARARSAPARVPGSTLSTSSPQAIGSCAALQQPDMPATPGITSTGKRSFRRT